MKSSTAGFFVFDLHLCSSTMEKWTSLNGIDTHDVHECNRTATETLLDFAEEAL